MKTIRMLSMAILMLSGGIASYGQGTESEVPGDNFSLEGALELFKQSKSPEEFEKLLNSPDSKVNNLDLNGDGYIDYIRVFDKNEGNVHAFILQAVVSETENQDVAVIELEKLANGKAVLQIIGDEDIYGIETIIEPTREVQTYAGTTSSNVVVNVWAWPSVQYVYSPYYSGWSSPWGWYSRPFWWHTWSPIAYVHYYPIWRPYYRHYSYCNTHRVIYAHRLYRPYRTTSAAVYSRNSSRIQHYRSSRTNDYRNGRTRNDDRHNYGRSESGSGRTSTPVRQRSDNSRYNTTTRTSSNANYPRRQVDPNRRSSTQQDVIPSPNRTAYRERNSAPSTNTQRSSGGIRQSEQRPVVRERSSSNQINRNSGSGTTNGVRRQGTTQRSQPSFNSGRQSRQSSGSNSRSSGGSHVQQRSSSPHQSGGGASRSHSGSKRGRD